MTWLAAAFRRVLGAVNRKSVATGVAMALLSTAIVVAAVRADGTAATNVQLDDGSVWVTTHESGRVGRLNIQIRELDFSAFAGADADVLQQGRNVVYTGFNGGVQRLDVVSGTPSGSNDINLAHYQLGAGVAAVFDEQSGHLWVGRPDAIVAPEFPEGADGRLPAGSQVFVTAAIEGRSDRLGGPLSAVLVVTPSGWFELALNEFGKPDFEGGDDEAGPPGQDEDDDVVSEDIATDDDDQPRDIPIPELRPIPGGSDDAIEATTVGAALYFLLGDGSVAGPEGVSSAVPGEEVRLQQPGGEADGVLVASTQGLFEVSSTGELDQLSSQAGSPAAPVRVGPCVYGAWTSDVPTAFKQCGAAVRLDGVALSSATPNEPLVWRVNGKNVALNSPGDGGVWADHEGEMAFVGNWSDVEPQSLDSEVRDESVGESLQVIERTCVEGRDDPPTAGDDQLGARPRQSVLNLLTNDDDINCEPIAVSSLEPESGDWGQLTIIDNGQHVLFSPSDELVAGATEEVRLVSFSYTVADSSGNTSAPATVTLTVKDAALGNAAPILLPKVGGRTREMRTVVEEGKAVTHDVLGDWIDPDGDEIRLVSAFPEGLGEVNSTPEGLVRYAALGVPPGVLNVSVTMSDGELSATEKLEVTVKPVGSPLPPVTSSDFVTVVAGGSATVEPLANDSDPNEDRLDLRPLWLNDTSASNGYRSSLDENGVVEIVGLEPGVYALDYEAYDGVEATKGTIRVHVLPVPEFNTAPVAVPDQVKIRSSRVINIDVLSNDVDLDGDLLSVVSVDVAEVDPTAGSVEATIVDRELVQLEVRPGTDGTEPTGPFTVTYVVDDGRGEERAARQNADENRADALRSLGSVTVLVQSATEDQPPILKSDRATVRSGDIVAVPVLRNDSDPDSDPLTLESVDPVRAAELEAAGQGTVWLDGRQIYYQGAQPGTYRILYNVRAGSRQASSELTVEVKALPEDGDNQAPTPADLVLRAVRGSEVRLFVPLYGVDPDGDAVEVLDEFTDLAGGGSGNRVRLDEDQPNVVIFSASDRSPATDSFTYTVRDRFGARASATVRVVVLDISGPPQAFDDVYVGKPGRTLSIPVLANDTSPLDRRLEIAEMPFFDRQGEISAVPVNEGAVELLDQREEENRGRVEVVVPGVGQPTLVEHYRITDGFNPSSAYIRVVADPDAPNLPPLAEPDVVTSDELGVGDTHLVDVLANDVDPDDVDAVLTLELPAGQNAVLDGGQVRVNLEEVSQTVLYRILDTDGASAVGRISVPAVTNAPPRLSAAGQDPSQRVIEAGIDSLTISLLEIVEDPDGDDFVLTSREVAILGGLGSISRDEDGLGFVFTPPPELQFPQTIAIQFEVTDRPEQSLEQRQLPNCNCVALLETEVTIAASSPPRILDVGQVQVPQLDEPVTYDLAPLSIDDQGDRLTYTLDLSNSGVLEVTQDGSRITVVSQGEGENKLSPGDTIRLDYTVSDGTFDPVPNTVVIEVIATNRGEPLTAPLSIPDALRDEEYVLPNLVERAFNPFADTGRPLVLENANVTAGASFTCEEGGDCTFFTDTVGTYTANYTLRDALDRTVTESVEILVKGAPRAPGVPAIESVGDNLVNLTWAAADMQGGELVRYTVSAFEDGQSSPFAVQEFSGTGGTFTGLVNAVTYRFSVVAENEIGVGEESAPLSSPAVPDRVPDAPENLRITDYQDGSLTLEWDEPSTAFDYTAIVQYEVAIGGQSLLVGGTTFSLTVGTLGVGAPLVNGTPYTFRVRAQNSATTDNGWGAWSGDSGSETPSRYPDPPTAVTATNSGDGGTPRLTVTWAGPAFDGGRPIDSYEVCRIEAPGGCQTVVGLTTTFDAVRNTSPTFQVRAFNSDRNRNDSDFSAASAAVTAVGDPDAPVISAVTSGNRTLTVTASSPNNSGCSAFFIEYALDGGPWQASNVFTGLTNGVAYTATARTTLAASCGTPGVAYESGTSAGVVGTPYGPLVQPTLNLTATSQTNIRVDWATNRADDGRPAWTASISGGSGCARSVGETSGSFNIAVTAGSTRTCTITVSATGVASLAASDTATTPNPPPPPATISLGRGGSFVGGSCGATDGCTWVTGSGSNFQPNTQYWIRCYDGGGNFVNTQAGIPVTYAPRSTNASGALSWGSGICGSNFTHSVEVWDAAGNRASGTASFP